MKLIQIVFVFISFQMSTLALAEDAKLEENKSPAKVGLSKEVINGQIKKHQEQISHCYVKGLEGDSKLSGKIIVSFKIDKNGDVASSEVKDSTIKNEKVESCVKYVVSKIKFPAPVGGGDVEVSYPFDFKPSAKK